VDITQLILDDHHEQRRLFALLEEVGEKDSDALSALWGRLSTFLEVHAAAEEAIFYPELLRVDRRVGRLRRGEEETLDAIQDHNEIRDSIAAVAQHEVGSDGWHRAVATVNQVNGDHMAEEEREGLTDFRLSASLQLRHDLGLAFAVFEARNVAGVEPVDKDPQAYVREAERAIGSGLPPGSLGIGGLKGR
jgi:Hemerythrin HHE cation binding domain